MSMAIPPKQPERGFQLEMEADKTTGKPRMRLLAFGKNHHFYLHVWVPNSSKETIPPQFVETLLPISGELVKLGIDCNHFIEHFQVLERARIIVLRDVQSACLRKVFDQFILKIEQPLRWKQHLSWCVKKEQVSLLLEFIYFNHAQWKKCCPKEGKIYIPSAGQIRYSFEYCRDGTLWMYYTYWHLDEMHSLVIDLESGTTFLAVEFPLDVGKKIIKFEPLFNHSKGIVQFVELETSEPRYFMGKQVLYDCTLDKCKFKLTLADKINIAEELLFGLACLENKGIVHCGIFPSTILIRYKNRVEGALSGFENAYMANAIPKAALIPPAKWNTFALPECSGSQENLSHPFAIPIFRLGMCLKRLFGQEDPTVSAIIENMLNADPALRPTAIQAMTAFGEDRKDSGEVELKEFI